MNKTNKLPESWCVKNDGSQLFKDTVVKCINNSGLNGITYEGVSNLHYGIDLINKFAGDKGESFGTELTLQEFISLTNEWEPKFGETVLNEGDKFIYIGKKDNSHLIVVYSAFNNLKNDGSATLYQVKEIEPYKVKLTLQQIAEKFDCSVNDLEII